MSRRHNLRRSLNLFALESRLAPATIVWNGSVNSNWSVAGNWGGGKVPATTDIAQFNVGAPAVTVDVAETVAAVEFNAGWGAGATLAANLTTTTGASLWNSGQIFGPGTWNAGGTVSLNGSTPTLNAAGLNITGTLNHVTANNLNVGNSAAITVAAGGTYDFQNDSSVAYIFGGAPTITVIGTVKKSSGTGTSTMPGTVNTQGGTWNALTGTLSMASAGGTHTGGTFIASLGATLDITGGQTATWNGTYTGSGAGVVTESSGTIAIDAAGATFNFPTGLYQWNGGQITGPGKLTNASTGFITLASGTTQLNAATISNAGTITHKSAGNMNTGNSSAFTNETTGVYDFQSDGDFLYVFGGEPTFVNKGLVKKTAGTGDSVLQAILSNQGGTWNALTGILHMLSDGGTHTGGTFKASAGAFLDVTNGATAIWKGTYTGSGAGVVYQGNGVISVDATGATFNFPAGLYEWDGGTITGGTLTITGTIKLNGTTAALNAGSISNAGTINHVAGTDLQLNNSAQFQNTATGTYDFQSDGDIYYAAGGPPTLTNNGLIRKTVGGGVSSVDGAVSTPSGIWEAKSGQLALHALGQTHTGGTFKATSPGLVNMTGGSGAVWKGSYTASGTGTVGIYDSTTIDVAGATFNFPAATPLHWSAGSINGGTLTNTGFILIDSTTVAISATTLVNQGTMTHTAVTDFQLNNSAQFQNTATGVYDFQSAGDIYNAAGGVPTFTNTGLVRKSAGAGVSSVDGAVSVPGGVWEAQTGQLGLRALSQTHTGGLFKASAGASVNLTSVSGANWKGSYTASGTGTVGIYDSTTIDVAGATFNFPAATPLHWSAGSINGGIMTNTGFIVIDSTTVAISATTLVNQGTMTHTAGTDFQLNNSAQFQNTSTGLYDFQSDGDIYNAAGGVPTFTNTGLVRKSAGAGVSNVDGAVSVPGGVWEAQTGQLGLRALSQTHTGGLFKASAGASVNLTSAIGANWKGTFISSGAGTVGIYDSTTIDGTGATFNFPAATPLHWSAGSINGGTLTNTGFILIDSTTVAISATTLVNQGTMTHTAGTDFQLNNSAQFQNTSTGLYDFQSDGDIYYAAGGTPTVTNSGLIRKSAGGGVSSVVLGGTFVSSGGLIDVQTGTIQLPTTYTPNKGGLLGKGTLANSVNNVDGFVRPGPISGVLTVAGNYSQGATALFVPEMKGTTVADFTQMQVNGTVTLDGVLRPQVAYTAKVGDTFTILSNDGADPIVGNFTNAVEGGSVVANGTTFSVTYKGGDGNDVVLKVTNVVAGPVTPPKVLFVSPNGGGAQRSRVTSLLVQFDQPIVQAGTTAAAFQLKRQSDNANVTLGGFDPNYFNGVFSKFGISPVLLDFATLTFTGGPVDFGSLADGRYSLTIQTNEITSANGKLDGDGNGVGGDNYNLVGTPANGLFRLFGDANGDGTVAASDFIQFRLSFGGTSNIFDFDGDGAVAASDFIQFRLRFGGSI